MNRSHPSLTMLVPRRSLLVLAALAGVPLLAVAGTGMAGAPLALAMAALLAAAIALDALRAWPLLDGLAVELPPVVRGARHRPLEIPVRVVAGDAAGRTVRVGLDLPTELPAPDPELEIPLPPSGVLRWVCRISPALRGRFHVPWVVVETASPWGWWTVRRRLPASCEVRVHPDLSRGIRAQARFLAQGGIGRQAMRQLGKGREFEKLRDYLPGDPSDEIHWKVTAKRRQPVTKVYQLERTQEVYVLVDASRLSGRTFVRPGADAPGEPLLEEAVNAALVLGAVAEGQGDQFGLVTFADSVQGFVRAGRGPAHFQACRERIVGLQLRRVSPDFEELATFLRLRLRRRALLLFLTDLDDPVASEGFLRGVDLLRTQHLCAVVQPRSADVEPAFSRGQAERVGLEEDLVGVLAGHLQWEASRGLEGELRRRGVTRVAAPGGALAGALVRRYLSVKRRQLL